MSVYEEIQKKKKIDFITKYKNKLQSFGYQDVSIKINPSFSGILTYFWDEYYGYRITLGCSSEDLILDDFTQLFEQIIFYIANPYIHKISLRKAIIPRHFYSLFDAYGFYNINYTSTEEKSNVYLSAYKNGIKYSFGFVRKNMEEELKYCSEENIEPLYFSAEEIGRYRDSLSSTFRIRSLLCGIEKYEYDITRDLKTIRAEIIHQSENYNITIHCLTTSLCKSDEGVRGIITNFFSGWLRRNDGNPNDFIHHLQKNEFHIADNTLDRGFLLIFKDFDIYEFRIEIKSSTGYHIPITRSPQKQVVDFDSLDGRSFETFCSKVLASNGFSNISLTQESGDQGVDIIAYKDEVKYGVQCKCYSTDIGNKAVQEVFAGKTYYNCHVGVVMTNRFFTKSAVDLANSNGVILWDRDKLLQLVKNMF